jgi:hypothetical protein
MGLGPLVGGRRRHGLAGAVVDVVMALGGPVDPVGPVEARVEPLRRIGRAHLAAHHVAHVVEEGAGVRLGVEVTALPPPIGPRAREPVEELGRLGLAPARLFVGAVVVLIGSGAPQPGGDVLLADGPELLGHAGLAEILLGQDVTGDLRPPGGHLDVIELEDERPVRVADFARGFAELDRLVR